MLVQVPLDAAFEALLDSFGRGPEDLLERPDVVARLLQYHLVVDGAVCSGHLDGEQYTELPGRTVVVTEDGTKVLDGAGQEATVLVSVPARNGVAWVIDRVLLPFHDGTDAPESRV
jgi:uncharacterized surface protein with fasciclin (FAS1) repeats